MKAFIENILTKPFSESQPGQLFDRRSYTSSSGEFIVPNRQYGGIAIHRNFIA